MEVMTDKEDSRSIYDSNSKLVFEFFKVFARFEYALKRTDDFLTFDRYDNAKPDWDTFAKELDSKFKEIGSKYFLTAVKYFKSKPPKKQVKDDARLRFKVVSPRKTTDTENILELVRRVRNNLFHGGKFSSGPVEGSERDETLIKHSLVILRECKSIDEDVEKDFDEDFEYSTCSYFK